MTRRRPALLALSLLALAPVALVGCGDDEPPVASPASAASATPAPAPRTPDAVIDTGQAVLITDTAVLPRQLLSRVGLAVEFRNDGSAPLTVRFLVGSLTSPEVPPGGSWSWTPDALGTFGFTVLGGADRRGVILPELPD